MRLRGPVPLFVLTLLPALAQTPTTHPSPLVFESTFKANGSVTINAVATDADGNTYVAGTTTAFDFPVKNAFQDKNSGVPIIASDDGGQSWRPLAYMPDLPLTHLIAPAVHPSLPSLLIAPGLYGMYRSSDAGASWTRTIDLDLPGERERIGYLGRAFFHPLNPNIVFAASSGGLLKSADSGLTWRLITKGLGPGYCCTPIAVTIDPFDTSRMYFAHHESAYVSNDSGESWSRMDVPEGSIGQFVADPHRPGALYLFSYNGAWLSTDRGQSWAQISVGPSDSLHPDPSVPGRLYIRKNGVLLRSDDSGATWRTLDVPSSKPGDSPAVMALAVFPGRLIINLAPAGSAYYRLTFISTDAGASWQPASNWRHLHDFSLDPSNPNRIYAAGRPTSDAFLAKFSPTGEILFSTLLGGSSDDSITAMKLLPGGSIFVAGSTDSSDFPAAIAGPLQGTAPSLFAAVLDPSGRPLRTAHFGDGRFFEEVSAITTDAQGRLLLTGIAGPDDPANSNYPASFVARLASSNLAIDKFSKTNGESSTIAATPEGGFLLGGVFHLDSGVANLLTFDENASLTSTAVLPVVPTKLLAPSPGRIIVAGDANPEKPPPVSADAFQTTMHSQCQGANYTDASIPIPIPRSYYTDVWLAELDANANPVWATLYGGSCRDSVHDIALMSDGSFWLSGLTGSVNLPVKNPLFGPSTYRGPIVFLARIAPRGKGLLFSTWIDSTRTALLAAHTESSASVATLEANRCCFAYPLSRVTRVNIFPAAEGPSIHRIQNAFDGREAPLAPLEIVRVTAPGLVPERPINLGLNPPSGAPLSLSGVSIEFNGVKAGILDVWNGGLICIVPAALRGASSAEIVLTQEGAASTPFYAPVYRSKLVFFQQVRNPDGTLNSRDEPAPAGSTVTFFVNGSISPTVTLEVSYEYAYPIGLPRVPVPPLRPVPGFVEGFWMFQIPTPCVPGTFNAILSSTSTGDHLDSVYTKVSIITK